MTEQKIIKENACPNCGCKETKSFKRTKGAMTYEVHVCTKCKCVIRRKVG